VRVCVWGAQVVGTVVACFLPCFVVAGGGRMLGAEHLCSWLLSRRCSLHTQVRHRNLSVYNRLLSLLKDSSRRFFLFSNEHNKDTFTAHRPGESPNDRNDRAIRKCAAWYGTHLRDSVKVRARLRACATG
jgi:hypothetical protein